jgi:cytochrome c
MRNAKHLVLSIVLVTTLLLSYSISSVAAANGTDDEFNTGSLSGFWAKLGSASATYALTGSAMSITCPANLDIGGTNDNAPQLVQSVSGDFICTTKVSGTFTAAGTHAGIIVWKDNTHFMRVEVRDVNKVQIGGKNSGSFIFTPGTPTGWTPDTPIYLKLDRTGSTITGYWSSDGSTWNNFGNQPLSTTSAVQVGIFVINQNAAPATFTAAFDYFRFVNPISPLPESPIVALALPLVVIGAFAVYRLKPLNGKLRRTQ